MLQPTNAVGDLLRDARPEAIDDYLRTALRDCEEGRSPRDLYALRVRMLVHGEGPWAAARHVFDTGIGTRSFRMLMHQATLVRAEILSQFAVSIDDLLDELRRTGQTYASLDQLNDLRDALKESDLNAIAEIRLRLVGG